MNARRFLTAVIVLFLLACGGAPRVAPATERIAAVVNKEAILASDVDEQTKDAAQRMNVDPADTSSYKRLRRVGRPRQLGPHGHRRGSEPGG